MDRREQLPRREGGRNSAADGRAHSHGVDLTTRFSAGAGIDDAVCAGNSGRGLSRDAQDGDREGSGQSEAGGHAVREAQGLVTDVAARAGGRDKAPDRVRRDSASVPHGVRMKLMFSRIRDGCALRAQREPIRTGAAVLAVVAVFFAARALGANDPSAVTDLAGSALTAEQIVAKNIEARGGLDAWRKVESMIWLGHIDGEGAPTPDVKFVLEQKRPNKSRFEMKSANQDNVRV